MPTTSRRSPLTLLAAPAVAAIVVVIWCRAFSAPFGSAELRKT
jgi:hypothetical protein